MTLKRPGASASSTQPGVPMLIVSDGRALTFDRLRGAAGAALADPQQPAWRLLDPSRDVSRFGRLMPTADPNVISIEVRDRAHPEYGVITLIFVRKAAAPGGLELVSWVSARFAEQADDDSTCRIISMESGRAGQHVQVE